MKELIDKSDITAEIKKLRSNLIYGACSSQIAMETRCKEEAYNEVLSFIDTIEVKEGDLEKEIELIKGDYEQVDVAWNNDFDFIARHFFELGLKARKEE